MLIGGASYKIVETRWHKQQARVRVAGVTRLELGEALIGALVEIPADDLPTLGEGEYMVSDLIGLSVVDEAGKPLGTLDDVLNGSAQDVYQISGVLVPAVKEFILSVDLDARRMVIRPLAGMFEDVPE